MGITDKIGWYEDWIKKKSKMIVKEEERRAEKVLINSIGSSHAVRSGFLLSKYTVFNSTFKVYEKYVTYKVKFLHVYYSCTSVFKLIQIL